MIDAEWITGWGKKYPPESDNVLTPFMRVSTHVGITTATIS